MDNPFYYGEEVSGPYFTNREQEFKDLVLDLSRGQNVILFSPRRYGKTSLIKKVLSHLALKGFLTFYINLYAATSKKKFVDIYARSIALGTKGKLTQMIKTLKELLPRMLPKVVIKGDEGVDFEFDYNQTSKDKTPYLENLFEAVEKYALKKKKRAVVVFDEFQEILNLEDEEVERSMRGSIQAHKKTAYVFMGSRQHLMHKIFSDKNRPFYKSGRMFPLNKISPDAFTSFIQNKLAQGKIKISHQEIKSLLNITECHPYYTQMLCSVLWDRNSQKGIIDTQSIQGAVKEVIERESYTYSMIWDNLTSTKKLFLEALTKEPGGKIYSQEFLTKFQLGNASTIQKTIKKLENEGFIYKEHSHFVFADIFFKQWILSKISFFTG